MLRALSSMPMCLEPCERKEKKDESHMATWPFMGHLELLVTRYTAASCFLKIKKKCKCAVSREQEQRAAYASERDGFTKHIAFTS